MAAQPPPPPPGGGGDEYFYEDDQKAEQGPFTLAQLQQWFTAGFLPPHIMTKKGRNGPLKKAGDYVEIAGAVRQPPPAFPHLPILFPLSPRFPAFPPGTPGSFLFSPCPKN